MLEIGSSFVVKMSQNCTRTEIVARKGGFFFGRAKRRPDVFRGEMGNWVRREPRFFVRRKRRFSGKIESGNQFNEQAVIFGFNSRLGQFRLA